MGDDGIKRNAFYNPTDGVYILNYMELSAKNNLFIGNNVSITAHDQKGKKVKVLNNEFYNFNEGVVTSIGIHAKEVNISDNTFNMDSSTTQPITYGSVNYGNTAIDVEQNTTFVYSHVIVDDNTISNSRFGIHLRNLSSTKTVADTVDGNEVYPTISVADLNHDSLVHIGIWIENSDTISVTNNKVEWNRMPVDYSKLFIHGISISDVNGATILANHIKKLAEGINIFDDCRGSNLQCNTLDTCYVGVLLNPNGVNKMTDQGYDGGSFILRVSWRNHWIDNTANKVSGTESPTVPFNWMYKPADGLAFNPGTSLIYNLDSAAANNSCSPPLRLAASGSSGQSTGQSETDTTDDLITQTLDSLANQNTIESNSDFVRLVDSVYYSNDTVPDPETILQLNNIAHTHPYYGGDAVYFARALLKLDIEDRLQWTERKMSNHQTKISDAALHGRLFPNPTSESITFTYLIDDNQKYELVIYDKLGRAISQCGIRKNSTVISTALYQQGVYFVELMENDRLKEVYRLTIIR